MCCSHQSEDSTSDRHSLGRLVERNSSDVKFLDLINSTNGQSAVIGQSQTATEGKGDQHAAPTVSTQMMCRYGQG